MTGVSAPWPFFDDGPPEDLGRLGEPDPPSEDDIAERSVRSKARAQW